MVDVGVSDPLDVAGVSGGVGLGDGSPDTGVDSVTKEVVSADDLTSVSVGVASMIVGGGAGTGVILEGMM